MDDRIRLLQRLAKQGILMGSVLTGLRQNEPLDTILSEGDVLKLQRLLSSDSVLLPASEWRALEALLQEMEGAEAATGEEIPFFSDARPRQRLRVEPTTKIHRSTDLRLVSGGIRSNIPPIFRREDVLDFETIGPAHLHVILRNRSSGVTTVNLKVLDLIQTPPVVLAVEGVQFEQSVTLDPRARRLATFDTELPILTPLRLEVMPVLGLCVYAYLFYTDGTRIPVPLVY